MSKKYLISGTVTPHKIEVVLNKMKFLGMEGIWTENRPTENENLKCKYADINDIPDDVGVRERYGILMDENTAGIIMSGKKWKQFIIYETERKIAMLLGLDVYTEEDLDWGILCKVGNDEEPVEDEKIPLERVLSDICISNGGSLSEGAKEYYYQEYATKIYNM